jgi:transposase
MIVLEDLKVRNLSKSAQGTADNHGKNVKAKSGLNKSMFECINCGYTANAHYIGACNILRVGNIQLAC